MVDAITDDARAARRSSAPSASATSCRSCCSPTIRRRGCGSSRTRGSSDEFLPELNAMRLEQDPIHRHKDVLAHTIAVVAKTSPELKVRLAALLHDVGKPKTRGFDDNGVTFHHHEVVGARMAKERLLALRYSERDRRGRHPARVPPPALPHLPDGLDRQRGASLRARRRAAARRAERADALRLHDPQRAQGRRRSRTAWTSWKRASPSCRSRRSSRRSGPTSTATRSWQFLGVPPGPVVGEATNVPARAAARRGSARQGSCVRTTRRVGRASAASNPRRSGSERRRRRRTPRPARHCR